MSYGLACRGLVCRYHCTPSHPRGLHRVQHRWQTSEFRLRQPQHALQRQHCDVVHCTCSCAAGDIGHRSRHRVKAAAAAAAALLPDDAAEPSSARLHIEQLFHFEDEAHA